MLSFCSPTRIAALAACSLLAAGAGSASAQPSMTPPGAPPGVVESAPPQRNWQLGVHLGGIGITSEADQQAAADSGTQAPRTQMGAVGIELRYRLAHRWQIAADATYMEGQLPQSPLTRRSGGLVLEGIFDLHRGPLWTWSIMLGLGGIRDDIAARKGGQDQVQSQFAEGLARLGVGVERRFDRLSIGAELYGVGLSRDDQKLDGPAFAGRDGPVPLKSSGGLLQLSARYAF